MVLRFPRRSWLLTALMLAALVPASSASDADSGDAGRASPAVQRLKSDIGRPEDFQRYIDGSRPRRGLLDDPRFDERRGARGPSAALRPNLPSSGPRLEAGSVPAAAPGAPSAAASTPTAARRLPFYARLASSNLPLRKLSAVLGLGFMLIAGSMLETPAERVPQPEPLGDLPAPAPCEAAAAPQPELAPTRFADALAERDFIDTRMPVPTWRAISLREQELIDAWDASAEKSLGLSSLEDWVGARGAASGVDVPLLQAKLRREA